MSTSKAEYERCDLCRRNHRRGKGHVYSKNHKRVLQDVITKFAKKVSLAKKCLKTPKVHPAEWEVDARRWCYFCAEEVERHVRHGDTAVEDEGFLRHLASELHRKSTLKFWKEQRLEKEKHQYFLVDEEKLKKFETTYNEAIDAYLREQAMARKTEAARIARQEALRSRLVTHHRRHVMSQMTVDPTSTWSADMRNAGTVGGDEQSAPGMGRRTVAAKAEGLTVVAPRAYNKAVGNIHSGALPPWLQSDPGSAETEPATIGPTQQDLNKHLESERKRKLPATRVGAKFDHQGETGVGWLPSFGRVWSNQRRAHSQQQFMRHFHKQTTKNFQPSRKASSALGRDPMLSYTDNLPPTSSSSGYQRKPPVPETSDLGSVGQDPLSRDRLGQFQDQNNSGCTAPNQYGPQHGNGDSYGNMDLYGNMDSYGNTNQNSYGDNAPNLYGDRDLNNPYGHKLHTRVPDMYRTGGASVNVRGLPTRGYGGSNSGSNHGGYPQTTYPSASGPPTNVNQQSVHHMDNRTTTHWSGEPSPSNFTGPRYQKSTAHSFTQGGGQHTQKGESKKAPPPRKMARIKIATSLLGP